MPGMLGSVPGWAGLGWAGLSWAGLAGLGVAGEIKQLDNGSSAVARLPGSRHRPGGRMAINQQTSVTLHTLTLHITLHITHYTPRITLEVNT